MLKKFRTALPDRVASKVRTNTTIRRLMGRDRMTVGVGVGLKFDPGPSNVAYASGASELPFQDALAASTKAGDVFYDIGANVGFFSVIGARLVGPAGLVYAFEPVPSNAEFVRSNAKSNGFKNVVVHEKAVSSTSGQGELTLAAYSGGAALSNVPKPPDATSVLPVALIAIDDLVVGQGAPPPSVVKIDVEGAELDVLQGMRQVLVSNRPIVLFEIDDHDQDQFDRKYDACATYLTSFNYQVTRLPDSYPNTNWLVGHAIATPASR